MATPREDKGKKNYRLGAEDRNSTLVGAMGSEDTLSLERPPDAVGLYGGGWLDTTSDDDQEGLLFSIG